MPTFTLIADYAGGTYISQNCASNPVHAVALWARSFDFTVIPRLPTTKLLGFKASILKDTPVPLNGLKNVWCASALLEDRSLILHIVQTAL